MARRAGGFLFGFFGAGGELPGRLERQADRAHSKQLKAGSRLSNKLARESPDPKGRLRVSNWIVQRIYDYAINKPIEMRLLGPF